MESRAANTAPEVRTAAARHARGGTTLLSAPPPAELSLRRPPVTGMNDGGLSNAMMMSERHLRSILRALNSNQPLSDGRDLSPSDGSSCIERGWVQGTAVVIGAYGIVEGHDLGYVGKPTPYYQLTPAGTTKLRELEQKGREGRLDPSR